MRAHLLVAWLVGSLATVASAEVSITKSPAGWQLTNGYVRIELARTSNAVQLKSLRREGGAEWAVSGSPLVTFPDKSKSRYHYSEDAISDLPKGGKQLALRFQSEAGGLLSLELRLYPTGAVVQTVTRLENRSQHDLLLEAHIDPLFLTLRNPAGGLKRYSSIKGQHGFHLTGSRLPEHKFPDWLVLENETAGESMLIGGEPGLGVLGWSATVQSSAVSTVVRAGTILIKDKKSGPSPTFDLAPGATVETPISFFALAKGDTDNAGNATPLHVLAHPRAQHLGTRSRKHQA